MKLCFSVISVIMICLNQNSLPLPHHRAAGTSTKLWLKQIKKIAILHWGKKLIHQILYQWFSARLQYLQSISNGNTAVLHYGIDIVQLIWQQNWDVSIFRSADRLKNMYWYLRYFSSGLTVAERFWYYYNIYISVPLLDILTSFYPRKQWKNIDSN